MTNGKKFLIGLALALFITLGVSVQFLHSAEPTTTVDSLTKYEQSIGTMTLIDPNGHDSVLDIRVRGNGDFIIKDSRLTNIMVLEPKRVAMLREYLNIYREFANEVESGKVKFRLSRDAGRLLIDYPYFSFITFIMYTTGAGGKDSAGMIISVLIGGDGENDRLTFTNKDIETFDGFLAKASPLSSTFSSSVSALTRIAERARTYMW